MREKGRVKQAEASRLGPRLRSDIHHSCRILFMRSKSLCWLLLDRGNHTGADTRRQAPREPFSKWSTAGEHPGPRLFNVLSFSLGLLFIFVVTCKLRVGRRVLLTGACLGLAVHLSS